MNLNITKLANLEADKAQDFLTKIDSKLMMDINKTHIIENNEWLDMLEFSIPHI